MSNCDKNQNVNCFWCILVILSVISLVARSGSPLCQPLSAFCKPPPPFGRWHNLWTAPNPYGHFHRIGPLGRFDLVVAMSVWCLKCCVSPFRVMALMHMFAPTSRSRMSKLFRDSESLGKSSGKKWSQNGTFFLESGLKLPRKKKFFFVRRF